MISWEGHLPTQVEIQCGEESHWIRWENGELTALNHPEASGERILAALAGERVACIEFLELWAGHRDDLRVLALATRGPGDPITLQAPGQPQRGPVRGGWAVATAPMVARQTVFGSSASAGLARGVPTGGAGFHPGPPPGHGGPFEDPVVRLITTGGPLTDRLVATVASIWTERVRSGDDAARLRRAALYAALYGRAVASVRTWLGAPRLTVDVQMIEEDQPASVRRGPDGPELQLPFSWIADVWARGLAVLLGRFVLRVADWSDSTLVLDAAGSDITENRVSTITINL